MAFDFNTFGEEKNTEGLAVVDGKFNIDRFGSAPTQEPQGKTGISGFTTGLAKSAGGAILGAGQIGQDILQGTVGRGVEALTGTPRNELGSSLLEKGTDAFNEAKSQTTARTTSEKVGKFTGDVAQFFVPGSAATKLTKGAGIIAKIVARAAGSGSVAALQSGEVGKDAAVAAGTEALLPGLGKVAGGVKNVVGFATKTTGSIMKNLLKGLGANVDAIADNPEAISAALKSLSGAEKSFLTKTLEKSSQTIQQGIRTVRGEARKAFGEGLEKLGLEDISPKNFRNSIETTLAKFGSVVSKGKRKLNNVEFNDPKNLSKASSLIDRLSSTKLDGKTLRKLADDIDASKFKTATSDERLSFNVFINDLSKGVKDAINSSTDKLKEINKQFTGEMQLVEAIEDIFGKQKFFSEKELQKISEKLPNALKKSGLSEENINSFFKRIGIDPTEFRATEAVRTSVSGRRVPEAEGLGLGEIRRQVSAAIFNPEQATKFSLFLERLPKNQLDKVSSIISKATEKTRPLVIKTIVDLFDGE